MPIFIEIACVPYHVVGGKSAVVPYYSKIRGYGPEFFTLLTFLALAIFLIHETKIS